MVSSSRSSSASPEPTESMQIFIKNLNGDTIPLTVPIDISLSNLKTLLSLRTSLPSTSLSLVHAGKHLPTSPSTLSALGIKPDSTLNLAVPMRGGMPPKKLRCTHKECREVAQRIVGDCGFCNGHFCGKHRLLEDHKCTGLEDVSCSPSGGPEAGCAGTTAAASSEEDPFAGLWGGARETQWWLVGLDLEELGLTNL